MKVSADIDFFSFSVERVLKKCGKWFSKMYGNPASYSLYSFFYSRWSVTSGLIADHEAG